MKIKEGDRVVIVGSAEEETYKGLVFEVISKPYYVCDQELVKMKCHETGKYFGGGYATKFLQVVNERKDKKDFRQPREIYICVAFTLDEMRDCIGYSPRSMNERLCRWYWTVNDGRPECLHQRKE